MKNWRGSDAHPSDSLIYWGDTLTKQEKRALRSAWDLLHSTPELVAASKLIHEYERKLARGEQADYEAGEGL